MFVRVATRMGRGVALGLALAVAVGASGVAHAQDCPTTYGASDAVDQDRFGWDVDIDGDIAVIGNLAGNGTRAGAVYVVDVVAGTELLQIVEPEEDSSSLFGYSVAIGEGKVVVGAPAFGRRSGVYVFDQTTGALAYPVLEAPDRFDGDNFGYCVAIGDGVLVVGAPRQLADTKPFNETGQVYVFDLASGTLQRTLTPAVGKLQSPDGAAFGECVDIDGNTLIVGAPSDQTSSKKRSGAAYVFAADSGRLLNRLVPSRFNEQFGTGFGSDVAIDGTTALVGAYLEDGGTDRSGAAYLFDLTARKGQEETHRLALEPEEESDLFGIEVELGDGLAFIYRPRIYVFDARTGERRSQLPADPATRSEFDDLGWALATDGNLLLAGAPRADVHGFDAGEIELFRIDELPDTPIVLEPEPEVSIVRFEIDIPGIGSFEFERRIVGRIVAEAPLDCKPPRSFQVTDVDLRLEGPEPTFTPAPNVEFTVHEPGLVLAGPGPVAMVQPDGSISLDVEVQVVGTFEFKSPFGDGLIDLAETGTQPFTINGNVDNSNGPLGFSIDLPTYEQEIETGSEAGNPVYRVSGSISANRVKLDYAVPIGAQTQKGGVTLDFVRDQRDNVKFGGIFDRTKPPALGDGVTGVLRVGAFRADVSLDRKGKSAKGAPVKMRLKVKKKKATFAVSIKKADLSAAFAAMPDPETLPRRIPWTFTLPDGWTIGGNIELDGKDKLKTAKDGTLTAAKLKMIKRK